MLFAQKIIPMEPQAQPQLPEDPDYYYQIKWDGVRILAFGENKMVRLQGRSLKEKSKLYPELAVLPEIVQAKSFILDGEVIALKENRPSFYTVMQRERAGSGGISRMMKLIPIFYMVFDLLFFDGHWLVRKPWQVRQALLAKILIANDRVLLTPNYQDGGALLEAVKAKEMEGVVAKKADSPYIPGPRKSSYWFKTKVQQMLQAYVGGISLKDQKPASLLLGLPEGEAEEGAIEKIRYIGSVGSGLKAKELAEWHNWARENRRNCPPFSNPPSSKGRTLLWVDPVRIVKVIFNEWTPDLKLRAPRLAGGDGPQ